LIGSVFLGVETNPTWIFHLLIYWLIDCQQQKWLPFVLAFHTGLHTVFLKAVNVTNFYYSSGKL